MNDNVLCEIFLWCDHKSLIQLTKTCRRFRNLISTMYIPNPGMFEMCKSGMYILIKRNIGKLDVDALSGAYSANRMNIVSKILSTSRIDINHRLQLACQYNDESRIDYCMRHGGKPEFGLLGACHGNNLYLMSEMMRKITVCVDDIDYDSLHAILDNCVRISMSERRQDTVRFVCTNAFMFDWTPDWHEYICTSIMNNYAEMIRVFICMYTYGWDDYFKNACMLERTEII